MLRGKEIAVHEISVDSPTSTLPIKDNGYEQAPKQENEKAASAEIEGLLFKPLLADPDWPHVSFSYSNIDDHIDLRHTAIASLGDVIPIYDFPHGRAGQCQVGLEGAVISLFDMDEPSRDLVNTDFYVGLPFIYRNGNFSFLGRFFHQSSHLGDEFLLRDRTDERVNLSYEGLTGLFSYELERGLPGLRLYGGPGVLVRHKPRELTPWILQTGVEYRGPIVADGWLSPLAALDVQFGRTEEFRPRYSGRIGFQLERCEFLHRKLQVFFEVYKGSFTHGQLYEYNVRGIGLGLHLFYD